MKVSYLRADGRESTAYLDDEDYDGDREYRGVNKHTDEPVVLRVRDGRWIEVES